MIKEQAENLNQNLISTLETQSEKISKTLELIINSLKNKGKILVCGNGGSAAESQHFVAELVVRFKENRRAIPAISLTTDTSNLTACGNDFGFEEIFARQVEALAKPNDVLLCLSTSGSSPNIIKAAQKARVLKTKIISLTGIKPNELEKVSDITIKAQAQSTNRIQEIHLFLIHFLAEEIERAMKNE